jgi:hypothetical protein
MEFFFAYEATNPPVRTRGVLLTGIFTRILGFGRISQIDTTVVSFISNGVRVSCSKTSESRVCTLRKITMLSPSQPTDCRKELENGQFNTRKEKGKPT